MENIRELKNILLSLFEVRKSSLQKEEFCHWLSKEMKHAGHRVTEERYGKTNGSVNLISGDPEKATVFLMAHYDTGSRMPIANFVSPTNVLAHIAYHFTFAFLLVVLAIVAAFAVTFPINQPQLTFPLFLILTVAMLFFSAYGPANKHNANSNTSGVLALLAIAHRIKKDDRICFVFLDNNERTLLGAKSFKRRHANAAASSLFINFDCVGDGEHLLLMPGKYSRWDGELLDALSEAFGEGEMEPHLLIKGLNYYPSDHRKFKFHVAVAACRHQAGLGYYIPHLRTKRDTALREENIFYIAESMARFLPLYFDAGKE